MKSYRIAQYTRPEWLQWHDKNQIPPRYWQTLHDADKYNWLRLNYHYQKLMPKTAPSVCHIDGAVFKSKYGFLCELGEQLFGAGGYIGSDWDGLYDALTGGISDIAQIPQTFTLIWHNRALSEQILSTDILTTIGEIFAQAKINVQYLSSY